MFNTLTIPCPVEYISYYTVSVQTAYVESVECMLSSNNYIKSGIIEIDSASNDLLTNLITSIENGISDLVNGFVNGLQNNQDTEIKEKFNAVVYMTYYYYKNQNATPPNPNILLGDINDMTIAESRLVARRCESSYSTFISQMESLKTDYAYTNQIVGAASSYVSKNDWQTIVKNYYNARVEVIHKTYVYSAIKSAHLYGMGINKCKGLTNSDQKLLVSELFSSFSTSTYYLHN